MKKLSIVVLLALLFSAIGTTSAAAQGTTTMVTLTQQNNSGQNGMAHLTANADGTTTVVLEIAPGAAGVAQPAHIHKGTCANLDPAPAFPLTSVMDGKSTTTVNVALADLMGGQQYAINVHKSGPEAAVYVSCGDITAAMAAPPTSGGPMGASSMVMLTQQNASGQNGTAQLTDNGNGTTTVVLDITPGAAGVAQPAHIHMGTCATLDPKPTYPLTSVMDGKSTTTVNVALADLVGSQPFAINVHKSGPEAAVYVSCGDIVAMAVPQPAPSGPTSTVTLSAQNNSGQNGTAVLTGNADGTTTVVLDITPGAAGVAQPAHIHMGTCATLDPKPTYPLTSVMDGKSTTTVNVALADLMGSQPFAINVHKSGPEAAVYVSCGNIAGSGSSPGMPRTGSGGEFFILAGLAILVLSMLGGGVLLRRRA